MGHAQALALALALVGVSVLLGAVLELAPPLLVQQIVDAHLALGPVEACSGSPPCLGATAAVQVMGFLTEYLTATIAQGVLRRLRVRLFAHLERYPCATMIAPRWGIPSRCTADVETVSTLTTAAAGGPVAASGGGQGGTSGATVPPRWCGWAPLARQCWPSARCCRWWRRWRCCRWCW